MSRIVVISDSHGSTANLDRFLPRIGQADALWHLGDCTEDAPVLSQRLNCGYVSVRGNCDPFSDMPLTETVDWHGMRFLLLHGHTVGGRMSLRYAAEEKRANAVLFGHSHVASIETAGDVLLLNPGSLSRPRGGCGPSLALLDLTDGRLLATLLFWNGTRIEDSQTFNIFMH